MKQQEYNPVEVVNSSVDDSWPEGDDCLTLKPIRTQRQAKRNLRGWMKIQFGLWLISFTMLCVLLQREFMTKKPFVSMVGSFETGFQTTELRKLDFYS